MTDKIVLINGIVFPESQAVVNIRDLAVQRGYGIFDFLKTYNGKPVFLDDHLDRFYNSAKEMHLPVSLSREELTAQLQQLIELNQIPESGVRLTLTGGYSADGFNIAEPNLIITQNRFTINHDPQKTISLITHSYRRQLYSAKTLDYMTAIWLQPQILEKQADDVLYHFDNLIGECPRANVFVVTSDGRVLTPARYILKGVTRKHVLSLKLPGVEITEAEVTKQDLENAAEVFITSTTKNILPVSRIDGRIIGNGRPGPITTQLSRSYRNLIYGEESVFSEV